MYRKHLPLDKTVVVEYKTTLADISGRSARMKGSVAVPVPQDSSYNEGDANASAAAPLRIEGIKAVVILSCFDAFQVTIFDGIGGSITSVCNGLFAFNGALGTIEIKPVGTNPIRIQYIWS